jgi:hypothetical protein
VEGTVKVGASKAITMTLAGAGFLLATLRFYSEETCRPAGGPGKTNGRQSEGSAAHQERRPPIQKLMEPESKEDRDWAAGSRNRG